MDKLGKPQLDEDIASIERLKAASERWLELARPLTRELTKEEMLADEKFFENLFDNIEKTGHDLEAALDDIPASFKKDHPEVNWKALIKNIRTAVKRPKKKWTREEKVDVACGSLELTARSIELILNILSSMH